MTTTIGAIELDQDMVWSDQFLYNPQNASVQDTLGGGRIVQNFVKMNETGRPVTLESLDQQGYQEQSTVELLKTLTEQPEAIYTLTIINNGMTVQKKVRLKNEIDGGAIQFTATQNLNGLRAPSAWYAGTISMEIV